MKHQREIEARWINLDKKEVLKGLKKIGAKKVGSYFFREWVFAHKEWRKDNRRIRVRTDGKITWLTYKSNKEGWKVDSTKEIEVTVSLAEDTVAMIKELDIPLLRFQEKKRDVFEYKGITFDMDYWPKIPMVLEIESHSEAKVKEGAKLLGLDWKDAIFEDQAVVHHKYYGIDMFKLSDYRFDK